MWVAVIVIIFIIILIQWKFTTRDVYTPITDEQGINNIVSNVPKTLEPVEVISRNGDTMRVMFFDTDTYAGKLMDYDVNTQIPRLVNPSLGHEIKPAKKSVTI
jgi:hypothetical protein